MIKHKGDKQAMEETNIIIKEQTIENPILNCLSLSMRTEFTAMHERRLLKVHGVEAVRKEHRYSAAIFYSPAIPSAEIINNVKLALLAQ